MADSKQTPVTDVKRGGTLAKPLAPEEIRIGDYVTPLHVFYDLPSFFWGDSSIGRRDELVRLCYLPETGGVPLKVISICLPFVLARHADGKRQTLDVRKVRLARLDRRYAQAAWQVRKQKKSKPCKQL